MESAGKSVRGSRSPRIAILMATCNGMAWIDAQVQSLLNQTGVEVVIFASDDASTDGTYAFLQKLANSEPRFKVLPQCERMGSAGSNFYRLLRDVDVEGFDFFAFSDQDDIWHKQKLLSHSLLALDRQADGVSSDVQAFWSDGRSVYIRKSQPMRDLDFIFESAGPGCTFLMTPRLVNTLKRLLLNPASLSSEVVLHDWLSYAVCRASGMNWVIADRSSLDYRQHASNVIGVNYGLRAALARSKKVHDGWYRGEVLKITKVCCEISRNDRLTNLEKLLRQSSYIANLRLLPHWWQSRRSLKDRLVLLVLLLTGLF